MGRERLRPGRHHWDRPSALHARMSLASLHDRTRMCHPISRKGRSRDPLFEGAHLRPDLLDNPHPLVSHAISRLTVIDATIRPQIRATNTCMRNTANDIGMGL